MKSMIAVLFATLALALGGCQKPEDKRIGPAEQAGREIDKAASVAGEKLDQAASKAEEKLGQAGEKLTRRPSRLAKS